MKSIQVNTRLKPVTKTKLSRHLDGPTIREILTSLAELVETNQYVKNKMLESIKNNRSKK